MLKDNVVKKTFGMKAPSLDQITAEYTRLGVLLRRELDRTTIARNQGPWSSLAFKYQDKDTENNWKPPKVMLAFFRNMNGVITRYSYFNIKTKLEAIRIINFLVKSFDIKRSELDGEDMF
jgi:hypothetical protein